MTDIGPSRGDAPPSVASDGRFRGTGRALGIAWGLVAVVLLVAVIGRHETGLAFGYFTRDPAAVMEGRVYVGFVSVVGLLVWWTGAVAVGLAAWHAWLRGDRQRSLCFGVMSASIGYLAIDDAFQLHENVYLSFGISDHVVEPIYILVALGLVVAGRQFLATTNWVLLLVAGIWFGVSVGLDVMSDDLRHVGFEDFTKLLGIATLTAYCLQAATSELRTGDRSPVHP